MSIAIDEYRRTVDERFVGLRLNTDKVKPVHVANGLFRTLLGQTYSTTLLNRAVFYQSQKGEVPKGHDLASVQQALLTNQRISKTINADDFQSLRVALRGVVNADGGVFTKGMESYSAGHQWFASKDRIGQEAGEFVAGWLKVRKSPLCEAIKSALLSDGDLVTTLCYPLLDREAAVTEPDIAFDKKLVSGRKAIVDRWNGLASAAECLAKHAEQHPDKLFRLRLSTLFAGLLVVRHITCLESHYCEDRVEPPPLVIDFASGKRRHIATASKRSFAQASQSIVRFYSWAFAQLLQEEFSEKQLARLDPPTYRNAVSDNAAQIWKTAKDEASRQDNMFEIYGEAIYDMLAVGAEADPVRYFRALGRHFGLLYPPNGASPWFSPTQDMIELLVYCTVSPGETISGNEMMARLLQRFGIIVGGRPEDEDVLRIAGITAWDRDGLRANAAEFLNGLSLMDFANQLADGVLKVRVGV